ncbi:PepSY domain-containing protein [Bacillus sp. 1P06AnD]|uniref:PepSY domain-containing protein n=1 Tax=Bacillus sp. 1P06AnD TaxID=3132208 RepID=UPI00399F3117
MKKTGTVLTGLILLIGLAGCSTQQAGGDESSNQGKDLEKSQFKVSAKEALHIAREKGDGDVTKLELEKENQKYAYKVEMMTDTEKTKIGIDANSKKIIKNKTDKLDDDKIKKDREQSKIELTGIISPKEAMEKATDKADGKATKWKIERKNGPTYYEVDVHKSGGKEDEVKVDAKDGHIISMGKDD